MSRWQVCLVSLLLLCRAASAEVRSLVLPTTGLISDRSSQRLYVSLPSSLGALGNRIAVIDPVTGTVGPYLFVGSEPGKMALSDDGQYLYVALDGAGAVRRVDLKTWTAGPQFSLGNDPSNGPYFALDLEVLPGEPRSIAVARRNAGYTIVYEGVAVYDEGVRRARATAEFTSNDSITVGATAARLYGYSTLERSLRRMSVDASGVTEVDTTRGLDLGDDIQFAEGLVYGTSGQVIDPEQRRVVGTFSGVTSPALMAIDAAADRVYFLTAPQPNGARKLLTFDQRNYQLVRSEEIHGIGGQASSLVRWGQERSDAGGGLALRTDRGRVFLIRTPLRAPTSPSADLILLDHTVPVPAVQGENLRLGLTVVNSGPSAATGVRLTVNLPSPSTDVIVSIETTRGRCEGPVNGQITCDLGTIPPEGRATLTVLLKPGANSPTGITSWSYTASVVAAEPDPAARSNRIEKTVPLQPREGTPPSVQSIRLLTLDTKDLVYDPRTRRIYASVPGSAGPGGNSITPIDPVSGTIGTPVFVGSEPGKLALSDDGHHLYVALDGAAVVRRFDVPAQTAGPQFSLGSDSSFGPFQVEDMAVVPGNPGVVAISRKNPNVSPRHAGVAIYENGVPRGKTTDDHTGSNVIEFSASPATLYGYNNETTEFGFRRMRVDESGVSVLDVRENLISGFNVDIRFDSGRIFTTHGRVIDPEAGTLLGTFAGVESGALVAPDMAAGRVFFLSGTGESRRLLVYDPRTFLFLKSMEIPGVKGRASSLIRWGQEGLAFRTDQGQVFLIRTDMLAPADFAFAVEPSTIVGGLSAVGTITLSQPAPAEGAEVGLHPTRPEIAVTGASVRIPPGARSASLPITTMRVTEPADVMLVAVYRGATRTVTLRVTPPSPNPRVVKLELLPATVVGGASAEGLVQIAEPAPASGRGVGLGTSDPSVVVLPAHVLVRPGMTTARFTIMTRPVTAPKQVAIWAAGGDVLVAHLTVQPLPRPSVTSLTLDPPAVVGGRSVEATITLSGPAPAGGRGVGLGTANPAIVLLPPSVVVPAGQTTVRFRINTRPVTAPTRVLVWAAGGVVVSRELEILPNASEGPELKSLSLSSLAAIGGDGVTGKVTLASPAPPQGRIVMLQVKGPDFASMPHWVMVQPGAASAEFAIRTQPVSDASPVVIYAETELEGRGLQLTVVPSGLSFFPNPVQGGKDAIGVFALGEPAPGDGARISLDSSHPEIASLA